VLLVAAQEMLAGDLRAVREAGLRPGRDRPQPDRPAEVVSVAVNSSVDLPSSAPAPAVVLSGWVFLPNIAAERED